MAWCFVFSYSPALTLSQMLPVEISPVTKQKASLIQV